MFTLTQVLGLVAQSLGMSQDALEKSLIDRLAKLDKGVQDIYMLLGRVSNSLADAPGGADLSGNAAGGLISPAVIAALPPLQTLDSTLSDLLLKLEPSIKLLLQFRDAAEKAVNGNEALTASLSAMAVAARGVSNLMSGLRADGSPRREPEEAGRIAALAGEATQRAIPGATAAQESTPKPIYSVAPPNAPTCGHGQSIAYPIYPVGLPDKTENNPLLDAQGFGLVDCSNKQILSYLARFEPILQRIDKKSAECLQYLLKIQVRGGGRNSGVADQLGDPASSVAAGIVAGVVLLLGAEVAVLIASALLLASWVYDIFTAKEIPLRNREYKLPKPNTIKGKENKAPVVELTGAKMDHPGESVLSSIEAVPPSTISNITNNYYDNTTNNSESYYGTLSRHELNQISFNKCLDKAMAELARDVESGMRTC